MDDQFLTCEELDEQCPIREGCNRNPGRDAVKIINQHKRKFDEYVADAVYKQRTYDEDVLLSYMGLHRGEVSRENLWGAFRCRAHDMIAVVEA